MNRLHIIYKMRLIALALFFMLSGSVLFAQNQAGENTKARATVIDEHTIKLRWAPTSARAWFDGRKYGYILERYTLMVDSIYQENPVKALSGIEVKAAPLEQWETQALKSDYAAVIAQAFYGEDFDLSSSSSNIGSIINQANELEQRFATSLFMAEYDYKAAELAGWAYTDTQTRKNEQYLYRIILNRPKKQVGDTVAIFIGYVDKKELPVPLNLDAVWGDRSVMLSWNYELLSSTYHSYHVERKSPSESTFKRITDLPITALGENMQSVFYSDSLPQNNIQYSYRVQGITTFNEEGPLSEIITGQGKKTISCIPNIVSGYFTATNKARIFWNFDCEEIEQIAKLVVKRATSPDGEFEIVKDNIPVHQKDEELDLIENINYLKLYAISKDSLETSSLPFNLNQEDSIPPLVPMGLKVAIDSLGVAQLSWLPNTELDLHGYRILRSFNENEEKSSVVSDFISGTSFSDTLSLSLANEKVYYSITALDTHFNESNPCPHVGVVKPNRATPSFPAITSYEVSAEGQVSLSWMTDPTRTDVRYIINRIYNHDILTQTIAFETDTASSYIDEVTQSGDYTYWVTARDTKGKRSDSPQKLDISVTVNKESKGISGFTSYVDRNNAYIELSWKKHPEATLYRLYKQIDNQPVFFWKEISNLENKVVDEIVSVGTIYTYTIIFINEAGRMSPAKTIKVDY